MIRKLFVGVCVLGTVAAAAVAYEAGHLAPYIKAMSSAEGLDVTYSIFEVGGTQTQYHVVLAKPNLASIDTPWKTMVADGEFITVYDKAKNTYYSKEQTTDSLNALFEDDELMVWRTFFDPKALDKVAKTKDEGSRKRRGETLNTVSAQIDPEGQFTVRFHLSQKDNLVRMAELISMEGTKEKTKVLNVKSISTNRPAADTFVFEAPADAKELTEADLSAEWLNNDLGTALDNAATFEKGVIIDFYADW
ncbi:MAG: hypothetical protein IH945_07190 [Armatimonadetes bacterium]|nr:hypothetical protein [Armatimonadota bacterium]